MYLKDGEITLRAMENEDVETLYRWENDTSLWNISDTVSPFSRGAIERFIDSSTMDQVRLMIDSGNRAVGCVDLFGISSVNHNASVGILIYDDDCRRCGIATRTLKLLEEFAYSSLEIISLKAEVSENNGPALSLFRRAGYREVGRLESWKRESFGAFTNVILFQKFLAR